MTEPPKGPPNLEQEVSGLSESSIELTDIDLGEDLIEKTATLTLTARTAERDALTRALAAADQKNQTSTTLSAPSLTSTPPVPTVSESLQNARILLGEGLVEDAKAALRKALIHFPENVSVLALMREIQDRELKRMILDSSASEPTKSRGSMPVDEREADDVIAALDADLKLGMLESTSLFQEELIRPEAVEVAMAGAHAQDLIDLGVGCLEIGARESAIRLFTMALKLETPGSAETTRSASGLLAEAQLEVGRPFDAIASMQIVLRDPAVTPAEKLQFFYLMGRSYESVEQGDLAGQWYAQVAAHDPDFRDVRERQDRLARKTR